MAIISAQKQIVSFVLGLYWLGNYKKINNSYKHFTKKKEKPHINSIIVSLVKVTLESQV